MFSTQAENRMFYNQIKRNVRTLITTTYLCLLLDALDFKYLICLPYIVDLTFSKLQIKITPLPERERIEILIMVLYVSQ